MKEKALKYLKSSLRIEWPKADGKYIRKVMDD
jgi:hypothetical protein